MLKPNRPEAILLVFVTLILLFAATSFVASAYRSELRNRAEMHFHQGQVLARGGKPDAAVEEYRAALTYSHNERRYELALSLALVALGRTGEAEAHFLELREGDPNNALVNLMLARIAVREGRVADAVAFYNRAIYGLWPSDPQKNRIQARFELVELLGNTGQARKALGELLSLAAEAPDDPAVQNRVAEMLLNYGSPQHAAEVFRGVLESQPRDPEAALGLARALFQEGKYRDAESQYRRALRLNPGDPRAQQRVAQIADMLALDPTVVTLRSSQRYARSLELIRRTTESLKACLGARAVPPDVQTLLDRSAEFLKAHRRHREGETPAALSLASKIWKARGDLCGPPPEDALALAMMKVTR
jgi:tetratricopeptide (TPR) repeat protein